MESISKEQIQKRYFGLSPVIQDMMFSDKASDAVRKAAVFGDIEDKVTDLAILTGYVLLGFLNQVDFAEEIKKELGVSGEVARQIASQIESEVFSGVQTELKKLYPPTIKTPTVISPSFAPKRAMEGKPAIATPATTAPLSGSTAKLAGKPEAKAGEFEKRFFKPAIPTTGEPKKTIPVPEDFLKARVPSPAPFAKEPPKEPTPAQLSGSTAKLEVPQLEKPSPSFAPEGAKEGKEAVIKPVVPLPTYIQSQFQKREPAESQYREKMEDRGVPSQPKVVPRVSGNVIDLRNRI